jgi:hypothetical protein
MPRYAPHEKDLSSRDVVSRHQPVEGAAAGRYRHMDDPRLRIPSDLPMNGAVHRRRRRGGRRDWSRSLSLAISCGRAPAHNRPVACPLHWLPFDRLSAKPVSRNMTICVRDRGSDRSRSVALLHAARAGWKCRVDGAQASYDVPAKPRGGNYSGPSRRGSRCSSSQ